MEIVFSQSLMDESNSLEEIRNWEHPPWYGITHFEEKIKEIFLENQKGLFHYLKTHFRMPVKHEMILVHFRKLHLPPSRWTQSQTLLAERRIILHSTEIGFTQFTLLEEKPPDGYVWSGRRLTRRQLTSRPSLLWPDLWRGMSKNAKLREKHKLSDEKPKLDNARRLRGIYFIDPQNMEFKEIIKNARIKLETPMAPVMLCKTFKKGKHGEACGKTNEFKSKLACILEASESTRLRIEESLPNHHEDHIAGKWDNSLQHYNLVHKFIPMPQAMKIPAAKAAVDKEWEKLEKIPAWDLTKVRNKSEVIDEARTMGRKSSFCLTDGHLSFEECWIGGEAPEIQRSSCTPRRHGARWFWILCSIHRARIISITNDGRKSNVYHIKTTRMRRTSSRRKICFSPDNDGRCTIVIENFQIGVSRHMESSATTQMAKIMVQNGRPSRSSWTKSVWSSFGRTTMGKAIWENPFEIRVGESFQLRMLIRTPWKRIILICVCGWHQTGWKETKY